MPYTQLSDVWVPETFASYQLVDPIRQTAFVQSGIVVDSPLLQNAAKGDGFITTVPYWNQIDSSIEPNYSNDVYTDVAEPQKVTAGQMIIRVSDLNEGWNSADLVAQLSGKDPLKMVAAELDAYWQEQLQRRVIAIAVGLHADNVAANGSDMTLDISSANMTVAAGNLFSASAVISAKLTLGDRMSKLAGIAVHSVVYARMLAQDQITFVKPSESSPEIPTYMGLYVIVDDGLPIVGGDGSTVAFKYLSILFGRGAVGYGQGAAKVPFELEREAARANGGGTETLWSRKRWAIHPFGYDFTSTTITGPGLSPTWANLKLAANWTRKLARKNVPMAFLVTNG